MQQFTYFTYAFIHSIEECIVVTTMLAMSKIHMTNDGILISSLLIIPQFIYGHGLVVN